MCETTLVLGNEVCISGGGISYRDNLMIYGHTPAHIHVWIRVHTRALINDILVILKLCKQSCFYLINKIIKESTSLYFK